MIDCIRIVNAVIVGLTLPPSAVLFRLRAWILSAGTCLYSEEFLLHVIEKFGSKWGRRG